MAAATGCSSTTAPLLKASMSPVDDNNHQKQNHQDQLLFSDDPNYALHGEIMMLVLVLLFIIFLFSILVFFLFMRRRRGQQGQHPKESSPEQIFQGNFPAVLHHHKDHHPDSTGSKLQHQQYEEFRSENYHQQLTAVV